MENSESPERLQYTITVYSYKVFELRDVGDILCFVHRNSQPAAHACCVQIHIVTNYPLKHSESFLHSFPRRQLRIEMWTAAKVVGVNGLPKIHLSSSVSRASADIYLFGSTLTSWVDKNGTENIFVSSLSHFNGVKAIRGGELDN